ncbi:uncharacterized protein LOC141858624 [Brevipalpus obovatus]|uniref:uncharacterized protein LOC141858624 n=1 Tax=Brevipalpus obovatus TaxID=246614 RepID=UPI003D9EB9C3
MDLSKKAPKQDAIGSWDRFKLFKWEISAKDMIQLYERDKNLNPGRSITNFLANYLHKKPECFVCNGIWVKQVRSLINVGDQICAQKVRITLLRRGKDSVIIEESGVADNIKSSRAIAFAKVRSRVDEFAQELDDSVSMAESEYFDAQSFLETELFENFPSSKNTSGNSLLNQSLKKRKREEICPLCQRSFCDKYYVEDHMLSVHELSCPFPGCKELFKTRANLNNHFLQVHNLNIRGLSLQELMYISKAAQEEENIANSSGNGIHVNKAVLSS